MGQSQIQLLPVEDASQLPTKRLNQVDLAIYVYMNTEQEKRPTSIDCLVFIRQSAPQKILDLPGLAVGVSTSESEKGTPSSQDIELRASQEAVDFCSASGLGVPLPLTTVEPLRAEMAKRAFTR